MAAVIYRCRRAKLISRCRRVCGVAKHKMNIGFALVLLLSICTSGVVRVEAECTDDSQCCAEAHCVITPKADGTSSSQCVKPDGTSCPTCLTGSQYVNGVCVPEDCQCTADTECCPNARCIRPRGAPPGVKRCVLPNDAICPCCPTGQHYENGRCISDICPCTASTECCPGAQCIIPRGGSVPQCVLPNDAICPCCPEGSSYQNGVCTPDECPCDSSEECCPTAQCIRPRGAPPGVKRCVLPNDAICPCCPVGQHFDNGRCIPDVCACTSNAECCPGSQCIIPRGGSIRQCVLPNDGICPCCPPGSSYQDGLCTPDACPCQSNDECCPTASCVIPRGGTVRQCVLPNDAICPCCPLGYHRQNGACVPDRCECNNREDCCDGAQCIKPRGGSVKQCVLPNDAICPCCPRGQQYHRGRCVPVRNRCVDCPFEDPTCFPRCKGRQQCRITSGGCNRCPSAVCRGPFGLFESPQSSM